MSSLIRTCFPLALGCSGAQTVANSPAPAPPISVPAPVSPEPVRAPSPPAAVSVESGQVSGVAGDDASILVFKGIPFAAPPVGELRWRPPEPPLHWDGVRVADTFSKSCTQELRRSYLPWTEEYMLRNDVSEDCLALNIWAPKAAVGTPAKLPVFVFIHGGAFNSGSGEVLLYDGENLAKQGILVVTINYRLGVFGFFAHPELSAESSEHSSGNYGLLDQIAALGWVQRNIAAFGGDPGNVTLGGQSAGAASVHDLTMSPLARGLFQRGIAESGPWDRRSPRGTHKDAESQGSKFAAGKSLAELRALSAPELFAKAHESGLRFRPIVDGWVVPDQMPALLARRALIDIPLLTGITADEGSSDANYGKVTQKKWPEYVRHQFGGSADALLPLYPVTSDAEAGERQKEIWRDSGLATLLDCRRVRAHTGQSKDFGYLFERSIPWPEHPEYQAFHSVELPYVFDNLSKMNRPWESVDRDLAALTSKYWVNFITRGDPNGPGLPEWPSDSDQVMHLGESTYAAPAFDEDKAHIFLSRFGKLP